MKKILILGLVPLLIAGVVVGLALTRIINIPGLTPKKKKPAALLAQNGVGKDGKPLAADPAASKDAPKDPKATVKKASADDGDSSDSSSAKKEVPKKPKAAAEPPKDLEKGASKLAAVWAEMKPDDLAKILPKYKDSELAPVLKKMDESTVAELLSKLDPTRAASLSRAIEASASELKTPAATP